MTFNLSILRIRKPSFLGVLTFILLESPTLMLYYACSVFLIMVRALVTGGCGFIGSHVVEKLILEGFQVLVIDNLSTGRAENIHGLKPIDLITKDLNATGKDIIKFNPDYIFHLAAWPRIQPSFADPIEHDIANVHQTISLLQAARECKVKGFIYSSSSSCYGDATYTPTDENHPINPLNPYAIQKYAAERYVNVLGNKYGFPTVSLRYFNAYGTRSYNPDNIYNAYSSVIGIFNHLKATNQPLTITGDGEQRRDFVHATDIASANLFVSSRIDNLNGSVFNVGYGATHSINEVASIFGGPRIYTPMRCGEATITHADISKIRSYGWQPTISLEYAIQHNLV